MDVVLLILVSVALAVGIVGMVFGLLAWIETEKDEDLTGQHRTLVHWHGHKEPPIGRALRDVTYTKGDFSHVLENDHDSIKIYVKGALASVYPTLLIYRFGAASKPKVYLEDRIAGAYYDAAYNNYVIDVTITRVDAHTCSISGETRYSGVSHFTMYWDRKLAWDFSLTATLDPADGYFNPNSTEVQNMFKYGGVTLYNLVYHYA